MQARKFQKSARVGAGVPSARDQAVLNAGGSRSSSVLFDFSKDGGALGTLSLGRLLPAGALVTNLFSDEITVLTSAGAATLKLQAGSTDLSDALAFDTGFAGSQSQALASSATAIKVSASSELKLVIAGAALTAGKVRFFVEYKLPND